MPSSPSLMRWLHATHTLFAGMRCESPSSKLDKFQPGGKKERKKKIPCVSVCCSRLNGSASYSMIGALRVSGSREMKNRTTKHSSQRYSIFVFPGAAAVFSNSIRALSRSTLYTRHPGCSMARGRIFPRRLQMDRCARANVPVQTRNSNSFALKRHVQTRSGATPGRQQSATRSLEHLLF